MAYRTLLTNTIGKTTELTIKNISFNMHYQRLIRGKLKPVNTRLDQDKTSYRI
jgi:hypothetical protein